MPKFSKLTKQFFDSETILAQEFSKPNYESEEVLRALTTLDIGVFNLENYLETGNELTIINGFITMDLNPAIKAVKEKEAACKNETTKLIIKTLVDCFDIYILYLESKTELNSKVIEPKITTFTKATHELTTPGTHAFLSSAIAFLNEIKVELEMKAQVEQEKRLSGLRVNSTFQPTQPTSSSEQLSSPQHLQRAPTCG